MKTEGTVFFKTGAWILLLAGFGHAGAAFLDGFLSGAFSPASDEAMTVVAALFYFWLPLAILAASLICLIIARCNRGKGGAYAAR